MYGKEDDLVDYNEDELLDYNDPNAFRDEQPSSHTPTHTPRNLDSENEGEDEITEDPVEGVMRDLVEEGRKADEDIRAAELAKREKRLKEFEALSLKLSENGYKMRMKVLADPTQAFRPMPMTAPSKTLAEILQTVPSEDAEQISEFQGLVYMPEQFMEIPTAYNADKEAP
jgi:hypothetical protein